MSKRSLPMVVSLLDCAEDRVKEKMGVPECAEEFSVRKAYDLYLFKC